MSIQILELNKNNVRTLDYIDSNTTLISFKKDSEEPWYGDYGVYFYSDNRCELENFIKDPWLLKTQIPDITKAKNICIPSKSTIFPSTLLSRLGINLTRVVKESKADCVVVSTPSAETRSEYIKIMCKHDDVWYKYDKYKDPRVLKIITNSKSAGDPIIYGIRTCCTVTAAKALLEFIDNPKYIREEDFIEYVNSLLPVPSEDELKGMCSMIASCDDESYLAGVNTSVYYQLNGLAKLDIVEALLDNLHTRRYSAGQGVYEKYFYYRLCHGSASDLDSMLRYKYGKLDKLVYYADKQQIEFPLDKIRTATWDSVEKQANSTYVSVQYLNFIDAYVLLVKNEEFNESMVVPDKDARIEKIKKYARESILGNLSDELNKIKATIIIVDKN